METRHHSMVILCEGTVVGEDESQVLRHLQSTHWLASSIQHTGCDPEVGPLVQRHCQPTAADFEPRPYPHPAPSRGCWGTQCCHDQTSSAPLIRLQPPQVASIDPQPATSSCTCHQMQDDLDVGPDAMGIEQCRGDVPNQHISPSRPGQIIQRPCAVGVGPMAQNREPTHQGPRSMRVRIARLTSAWLSSTHDAP